jgi:hypothetical protein
LDQSDNETLLHIFSRFQRNVRVRS